MKPDLRLAPIDLWRIVSRYLTEVFTLFGAREQIAAQRVLDKAAYLLVLAWLRAGEWLMREVLLIEAALIGARAFRPAAKLYNKSGLKARAPLPPFHSVNPEDWRVSFCCFADRRHPRQLSLPARRGQSISPRSYFSAWPIAQRCEALLRVFNDPAACAKKLARRLLAKPEISARLLKIHPGANDQIGREDAARIRAAAHSARQAFDSS
jgi:hypothetical protein